MPQLVIEQPGIPTMTVPLTKGKTTLGRAEDNDVILVADEVSRHHVYVTIADGRAVLQDLKSLNGTYVNRQRVLERVLSHLDEVWLGSKCLVVFHADIRLPQVESATVRADKAPNRDIAYDQTYVPASSAEDSQIVPAEDLAKIRDEMDRVGNSLSMIGRRISGPIDAMDTGIVTPADTDMQAIARAYRRLDALYQASKLIASDFDLEKRLAAVLDTVVDVMEAERGFVMLRDEETGGLSVSVARAMGRDLKASSPSMGIAGQAAIRCEPVLMKDRESDSNFGGRESIIMQRIVSAMAVPLSVEDRVLGSIYVDTRQAVRPFTEEDLELFVALATQSAMAIDNVRLYEQMVEAEKKRADLGRFLSPAIVDQIMREDTVLELGGSKRTVTTMFCDIRGFTPLAERLEPDVLIDTLNQHFTALTEIIFRFEGTLDKYIGDEIMAVFGSPLSKPDDAERAVRAALAMQAKNAELNVERLAQGRPELGLGIGISTGEVLAGCMGSPDRMEFTVVGDKVNTASRLCGQAVAHQIVTGEATYQHVKDLVVAEEMGLISLRGKEAPVTAYHIVRLKA